MRMNRVTAGALGILSILPLASLLLVLFVLMPRLSQAGAAGERTLLLAVLAFAMLGLLIMAIFAVFAWRSRRVPLALKRRWTTRIVVGNLFTMPVFWYQFVWKDRPLEQRPTLEQYIS